MAGFARGARRAPRFSVRAPRRRPGARCGKRNPRRVAPGSGASSLSVAWLVWIVSHPLRWSQRFNCASHALLFFLHSGFWFGAGGEDQSVPRRSRRSHRASSSVRINLQINPLIQLHSPFCFFSSAMKPRRRQNEWFHKIPGACLGDFSDPFAPDLNMGAFRSDRRVTTSYEARRAWS